MRVATSAVCLRTCIVAALATQLGCVGDLQSPPIPDAEPRVFLTRVVDAMQTSSIRRHDIDWTQFRDTVLAHGESATSISGTLPAVQLALALLGDNHSWFRRPDGSFLGYPKTVSCVAPAAASLTGLPADIGYVRIPAFGGTSSEAGLYTQTVQNTYRSADSDSLVGWIVDLRGNTGGNMWPMLAALWPFLQGVAGHFVTPDSGWTSWSVDGPISYSGDQPLAIASSPFEPRGTAGRVAVLTDGRVASSGEATAIAFRGRANTRSFGANTCGLSTAIGAIALGGNYTLGLAVATMADRDSVVLGGVVPVDEEVSDASDLTTRVITWIRTGALTQDTDESVRPDDDRIVRR